MGHTGISKPMHVHFIGIGGISMSALAEILLDEGFIVSGSDMTKSSLTDHLAEKGVKIYIGQHAQNVDDMPDLVVYTAAIRPDNPEYAECVKLGIPMQSRAEMLGRVMGNYKEVINISGTHGKTTTTSMIADICLEAGMDPTVSVGGLLDMIGGNLRMGSHDLFIAEACEYMNSFLSFYPTIAVVLNVEADHLDFFKDINDIRHSFKEFIYRLPQNKKGFLVINGDINDISYFTKDLMCEFVTFGHQDFCDLRAIDLSFDEKACASYILIIKGRKWGRVKLSIPGEHNVKNSLAAIAVALRLGIDVKKTVDALKKFKGVHRRFELKGQVNGFNIIDDYAHHPQEIEASLKAAALYPHRKIYVVFQPHTYSRTKALLDDFATALKSADQVILADIFAAREKNTLGISSAVLADEIMRKGGQALYIPDFEEIKNYVLENVQAGDLLITMGAGNIVKIADALVSGH